MKQKEFKVVRVKKELKFKTYSKENLSRLKKLANKIVSVKKISGFIYQIRGEETLIFRGDFKLLDESYRRVALT